MNNVKVSSPGEEQFQGFVTREGTGGIMAATISGDNLNQVKRF